MDYSILSLGMYNEVCERQDYASPCPADRCFSKVCHAVLEVPSTMKLDHFCSITILNILIIFAFLV